MREKPESHLETRDYFINETTAPGRFDDLRRIEAALREAESLFKTPSSHRLQVAFKQGGDPVTAMDIAVDELLRKRLPQEDEGWLSEESVDDSCRLQKRRVWVVDPLDGTKEFVAGIPEWCVSIALIEDGEPAAGGICNPATGEIFLGSHGTRSQYRSSRRILRQNQRRGRPLVLASRSEMQRGEWNWLADAPFDVRGVGSVAYKLALVSARQADATWTLVPKSEWDIAAGVALVLASGGKVRTLNGGPLAFNQPDTRWEGLVAFSADAGEESIQVFEDWLSRRSNTTPADLG